MTPRETNDYRTRLLKLGRRLDSRRAGLKDEAMHTMGGESSGGLSSVPVHPADLGTHEYEGEMALHLLTNEQQLMEEVSEALERIASGTFGRCEKCGNLIAKGRLEAAPYVRHCIKCANVEQRGPGEGGAS